MNVTVTTKYVCGIDLHARKMSCCVMDLSGKILGKKNMRCEFVLLHEFLKPWLNSITVGVESTFNWYWLLDALADNKIPCYLGHALYIKRMSGKKHKNDPVDAQELADLLRTNRFPMAYAYPREMRSGRDLLRRRHHLVRKRAGALTHFQNTCTQHGYLKVVKADVHRKSTRRSIPEFTNDTILKQILISDLDYIESLDSIIDGVEKDIITNACKHNKTHYKLLQTISGCGPITSLTVLYETHIIGRFASQQCYSSYARVVRAENTSNGKDYGRTSHDKIGNPYLKWALSEIGSHLVLHSNLVQQWYQKQVTKHGKGSAMARLRHKLAVAIYHMLKNNVGFDEHKFLGIQKEQATTPAHNWQETSGKSSKPRCLIGKVPVPSLKRGNRKRKTGRISLRTTGKGKVRTIC